MSHIKPISLLVTLSVLSLLSCQRELDIASETPSHEETNKAEKEYTLSASASWGGVINTKANIVSEQNSSLTFDYSIFHAGSQKHLFYGNQSSGTIRLNPNGRYSLFMWSEMHNADDISAEPTYTNQSGLNTCLFSFSPTQAFWNSLSYIPLSAKYVDLTGRELDLLDGSEDGKIIIPMEYLMAKVNLTIEYDDLIKEMFSGSLGGSVNISSVKLGGAYLGVGIFDDSINSRSTSPNLIVQDPVSTPSLSGGSYVIYVPESLGGNLLPDNTDPTLKTPSSLTEAGVNPSRYPYIEAVVSFASNLMESDVKYRFYLGENATSNFDVHRNKVYNITLHIDYDSVGATFPGQWKIDATPTYDDVLTFEAHPSTAHVGQIVTLQHDYTAFGNDQNTLYAQPGGYAIGQYSDMESYLSSGTLPSGYTVISPTFDMVRCNSCDTYFHNVPRATLSGGRRAWLNGNLDQDPDDSNIYKCPWCGVVLFNFNSMTPGSLEYMFNMATVGSGKIAPVTSGNTSLIPYESNWVTYTVPAGTKTGSTLYFQLWTRDGRLIRSQDVNIGGGVGQPAFTREKKGDLYLAQRDTIVIGPAPASYGPDPSFDFSSSNTSVLEVKKLDKKTVVVSASKRVSGTASVIVKQSGESATALEIPITTKVPVLYLPASRKLSVKNGGESTAVSAPSYYKAEGSSYVQYTDYDEDLFASVLGAPDVVVNGAAPFIGAENKVVYGHKSHNIWLETVQPSSGYYLDNLKLKIGEISWKSPECSEVPVLTEDVFFENAELNLQRSMEPKTSRLQYYIDYTGQYSPARRYVVDNFTLPSSVSSDKLKLTGNPNITEKRNGYSESSTPSRVDYNSSTKKYRLLDKTTADQGFYIDYYYNVKGKDGEALKINFFRLNVYADHQAGFSVTTEDKPADLWMRGYEEHKASGVDYHYSLNEERWPLYHVFVSIVPESARSTFSTYFSLPDFDATVPTPWETRDYDYVYHPKRHRLPDAPNAWLYLKSQNTHEYTTTPTSYPFWATGTCFLEWNFSLSENCDFLVARDSRYKVNSTGYNAVIDRMWYRPLKDDDVTETIFLTLWPIAPAPLFWIMAAKAGTLIHTRYNVDTFKADNKPLYIPTPPDGDWQVDTSNPNRLSVMNSSTMKIYSLPNYF